MLHSADPFDGVLAALAADPSTDFGAPGTVVERLERIEGVYSRVQRVRIRTPARTVHAYVKVTNPRGPGDEGLAQADWFLRREFTATAAFYEAVAQDARIGAVRPLAFVPAHRAMVTEEVPGRPFSEILAEATVPTEDLLTIASRVGVWARVYQSMGDQPGVVHVTDLRAYLDHRLRLMEGRVISAAEREDTLRRFDRLAAELGTTEVPKVPIHADLWPMNIIVDHQGRVTVLDFTMAKRGTTCHDLSHLYFHLDLMAARDRERGELVAALQKAMLAGYDPSLSAGDPLFRIMLLQHGACQVAMLAERRVPLLDRLYRWYLRRTWALCEQVPLAARVL